MNACVFADCNSDATDGCGSRGCNTWLVVVHLIEGRVVFNFVRGAVAETGRDRACSRQHGPIMRFRFVQKSIKHAQSPVTKKINSMGRNVRLMLTLLTYLFTHNTA